MHGNEWHKIYVDSVVFLPTEGCVPHNVASPTPLRLNPPHSKVLYPAFISSCYQSNKIIFSVFTYNAFSVWQHVKAFVYKTALSNGNEI